METVFFLSGLEDDVYGKVLDVMEKYGRLELKGQRATKKTLTEKNGTTIDCPSYHFRPLRGDLRKLKRNVRTFKKCRGRKYVVCRYETGSK